MPCPPAALLAAALPCALLSPVGAAADPQPPIPANSTWEGRPQFWQVAAVDWSPPADAIYARRPARDAHHCGHLCLLDGSCAAADLVNGSEGLTCRLAARRGGGSGANASAVAALVRRGRAQLGERCLTDGECWQGLEGAGCVEGVCTCPAEALTARGDCVISDCSELTALGVTTSGQHWVRLAAGAAPVGVFCNMDKDGGGWTVFQRRRNDTEQVDFYRYWHHYRDGFGTVTGQFWLGNELIHRLTARGPHQLRIDLFDFEGNHRLVRYSSFAVAGEGDCYRLSVSGFSGAIGDSLGRHNGQCFSTKDRDNDRYDTGSCSRRFRGGWWYQRCHTANLNGFYWRGTFTEYASGVSWYHWLGHQYSLKTTAMLLRPVDAASTTR
ncbi:Ficolin-1 [Amphibalanus amphitrite]|uniref:Ficolin-1 n=1 Tax=Amphibalanus amphitrite TaxID=1232801 RepID=A0A6A4VQW8_AMPAM|nr:Ficolin-1 [Amphibalanus amphitrite]